MFLSEWREFPSAPCLAGGKRKTLMTARVLMLPKSRASLTCFRACFLPGRAKDLSAPRYNEACLCKNCCHGEAICITYSECVCVCVCVVLVTQHAKRKLCIILPSVACPALQYFSTLSHKRHDFRKKKMY